MTCSLALSTISPVLLPETKDFKVSRDFGHCRTCFGYPFSVCSQFQSSFPSIRAIFLLQPWHWRPHSTLCWLLSSQGNRAAHINRNGSVCLLSCCWKARCGTNWKREKLWLVGWLRGWFTGTLASYSDIFLASCLVYLNHTDVSKIIPHGQHWTYSFSCSSDGYSMYTALYAADRSTSLMRLVIWLPSGSPAAAWGNVECAYRPGMDRAVGRSANFWELSLNAVLAYSGTIGRNRWSSRRQI